MKYWHQSPQAVEHLASAYALGTLAGPARRRFEAVMRTHPHVARVVAEWDARLQPMAQRLEPLAPSAGLWRRIEQRVFASKHANPARRGGWRWLPAGMLAIGLLAGTLLPMLFSTLRGGDVDDTQLPSSYVGVLATPEGRTGMIVSSLRRGLVMDLKQVKPLALPDGKTLVLWILDAQGQPKAVGPVPNGPFVQVPLAEPAEAVFAQAVELAVSIEPVGATPATPSGAYVYRGLCGKLWRMKAVTPPS